MSEVTKIYRPDSEPIVAQTDSGPVYIYQWTDQYGHALVDLFRYEDDSDLGGAWRIEWRAGSQENSPNNRHPTILTFNRARSLVEGGVRDEWPGIEICDAAPACPSMGIPDDPTPEQVIDALPAAVDTCIRVLGRQQTVETVLSEVVKASARVLAQEHVRDADNWRAVRDEVRRLDWRSDGPPHMADDDVLDVVLRVLRDAIKSPKQAEEKAKRDAEIAKRAAGGEVIAHFLRKRDANEMTDAEFFRQARLTVRTMELGDAPNIALRDVLGTSEEVTSE